MPWLSWNLHVGKQIAEVCSSHSGAYVHRRLRSRSSAELYVESTTDLEDVDDGAASRLLAAIIFDLIPVEWESVTNAWTYLSTCHSGYAPPPLSLVLTRYAPLTCRGRHYTLHFWSPCVCVCVCARQRERAMHQLQYFILQGGPKK